MTITDKATQIKAVEKVFTLKKNGVTMPNARKIVAGEFNTSVFALRQLERKHGTKATTSFTETTNIHTSNYSFDDMSTDVRGVLRSIVKQDGQYSIREANAVGKLYSAELSKAKVLIDIHKLNTKTSDKKVLRLS
jgi:uncharacterized protein YoaH (UPF0181 family)|tara:strand:- start:500 stop:904 length:405 start_codon:yes stop_codon:yes gene_type:complete